MKILILLALCMTALLPVSHALYPDSPLPHLLHHLSRVKRAIPSTNPRLASLSNAEYLTMIGKALSTHKQTCKHNCCKQDQLNEFVASVPEDEKAQDLAALYLISCCEVSDEQALHDVEVTLDEVAQLPYSGKSRCSAEAVREAASGPLDLQPFKKVCCSPTANCCSVDGIMALGSEGTEVSDMDEVGWERSASIHIIHLGVQRRQGNGPLLRDEQPARMGIYYRQINAGCRIYKSFCN